MTNPLKVDPTRTTTLRARFQADMTGRFNKLRRAIVKFVGTDNEFDLGERKSGLQLNARYQFLTDSQKVDAFKEWMQGEVDKGVLEKTTSGEPWTATYIDSAYRKGIVRAFTDTTAGLPKTKSDDFYLGGKTQFLADAFAQPETVSKIQLLATRSFESLKGVNDKMASEMNRILADGIAHGKGPKEVARELTKSLDGYSKKDALRVARTEIIHAHSEGQLDAFERLGVEEVGAEVEWLTAGDSRVCPQCSSLEGAVFKLSEARGLIPRHPNCRCTWLPVISREKGQKRGKSLEKAILKSVRLERPKAKSDKKARAQSRWRGADIKPKKKAKKKS